MQWIGFVQIARPASLQLHPTLVAFAKRMDSLPKQTRELLGLGA